MLDRRRLLIANSQEGGELPSGYTRLNYLESKGNNTTYIETSIIPTANTGCKIITNTLLRNDAFIIGTRQSTSTNSRWGFGIQDGGSGKNDRYFGYGDYYYYTTQSIPRVYGIETYSLNYMNSGIAEIQISAGTYSTNLPSMGFTLTRAIYLFCANWGGSANLFWKGRIYDIEFTENNTVSAHFVPCLDTNNVPCMYDTVSQTPFYNAGTGDFLYG